MGTLRCDVCLGDKQRAIPAPFLPPLLHKHLGLLICGELLCCEVCSQKVQDWDIFASQTIHNLAISHPTAQASLQERIEKIGLLTAKLQQDTWGITSTAMGLHNNTATQILISENEIPSAVTTSELLVDKHEVFGCLDAQAFEDEGDAEMVDDSVDDSKSEGTQKRPTFAGSPSQETLQDTFEDTRPSDDSETSELMPQHSCPQCFKKFAQEEVLNLHIKIRHNIENKIKNLAVLNPKIKQNTPLCPKCNIKFSCDQYLLHHVMEYHAKEIEGHFCCVFCSQLLKSPGSLKYHTKKHFSSTQFLKCKFCPKHLSSTDSLDDHIQNEHYLTLDDKKNHFKFDTQQWIYICPLCFKGISSKHNLEGHLRSCKDGLKASTDISELNTTTEISDILKYTCEFCFRVSTSEKKLHHHFYRCHHDNIQRESSYITLPGPSFSCEFCDAKLVSKLFLQYHLQRRHLDSKTQEDEASNQCKFCGIMYSSIQMLRYHIHRRHNEFFPNQNALFKKNKAPSTYLCNFCKTPLCSKQGLQKHILTYHSASNKNSKFPCTICDNGFDSKAGLFHHMRHHPPMVNADKPRTSTKNTSRKTSKKCKINLKHSLVTGLQDSNGNSSNRSPKAAEDFTVSRKYNSSKGSKDSNRIRTARNTRASVRNFFNSSLFSSIKNAAESSSNYNSDLRSSFFSSDNSIHSNSQGEVVPTNDAAELDALKVLKVELSEEEEADKISEHESVPGEENESRNFYSFEPREDSISNSFQQSGMFLNTQVDDNSVSKDVNQEDVKPFVCQVCFTILHSEFARKKHATKCQGDKPNLN